jgi:hypothetical protein
MEPLKSCENNFKNTGKNCAQFVKVKVKVKHSIHRPGQAHKVPGG